MHHAGRPRGVYLHASSTTPMPPSHVTRPLRIALVSPRGPLYSHRGGAWKKQMRYAPLTLTTLAALVPDDVPAEITLIDEGIGDVPDAIEADLVGISAITGSAPRAYAIADRLRARGVPVVLGGVHPTLVPGEAQAHADAVVTGYAEDAWPELLRDFQAGRMRDRYAQAPGLSLAGRPHPRRDLLPTGRVAQSFTLEATRGCQHRCDFCVVPTAWGGPMQRPVAEVVDDIRRSGARRLLFLDLNLIGDVGYAKALFEALVPLKVTWGGLATVQIAHDADLLDLAARSGCRALLVGFESLSEAALAESHKRFNAPRTTPTAAYRHVVDALHGHGIAVMGCFVFGYDTDGPDVFDETAAFVHDANIDLPRYAVLTPFPATPLHARLRREGRLLTDDWSLYDGQHVVFEPARMSPDALLRGTERAWLRTYRWAGIAKRLAGSRTQLSLALATNLGYRYYARRLDRYYTCDWRLGLTPERAA